MQKYNSSALVLQNSKKRTITSLFSTTDFVKSVCAHHHRITEVLYYKFTILYKYNTVGCDNICAVYLNYLVRGLGFRVNHGKSPFL